MLENVKTHVDGVFVDEHGRQALLRGASVAGNCKLPINLDESNPQALFDNHRSVSFVGRPFPLNDADSHFRRLADYGMRFIRLIVTWEALEHAGPGIYDEDYLYYIVALIEMLPKYGLVACIDVHQDCWSRLTGGSGAPHWTLELAGFDISALTQCHAAYLHCMIKDPNAPHGLWPTGYQKLAVATMFTLFWASEEFAPNLRIPKSEHASGAALFSDIDSDTVAIGLFLRRSFSAAYSKLAERLAHCSALLGFEPMNEPHRGYLELHSFHIFDDKTDLALGHCPSALQSMALASGHSQLIPYYDRAFPVTQIFRHDLIKPERSAWTKGRTCIWANHNVWTWDEKKKQPIVMQNQYFEKHPHSGKTVDFYKDYWFPFIQEFGKQVHKHKESWMIFAGGIPNEYAPEWPAELQLKNLVYAPHFYDLKTLHEKAVGFLSYNVQGLSRGMFPLQAIYYGHKGMKDNYALQTRNLLYPKELPNLFSEIGTCMDSNLPPNKMPFTKRRRRRDWLWQTRQLDALLSAMDSNLCSYALWNHNHDNDGDEQSLGPKGDDWNGEDFSWVASRDGQVVTRCLEAIQRPYPILIAGRLTHFEFDMVSLSMRIEFSTSTNISSRETIVFLPQQLYGSGHLAWNCTGGSVTYDLATSLATFTHEENHQGGCNIELRVIGSGEVQRRKQAFASALESTFLKVTISVLVALFALAAYKTR